MRNKQKTQLIWLAVAIGLVAVFGLLVYQKSAPGELDGFAQCLSEKQVTFFGAFWCPHCRDQKELFGNSARLLPYVECSTPDGNAMTIECQKEDIKSYPTWEFADGSRETGELSLQFLAEKSGCELPVNY